MHEIGISTAYGVDLTEENFKSLKKAGLGAIEISMAKDSVIDFKEVLGWAKNYDVKLWSCHLPFRPETKNDISLKSSEARKNLVLHFKEIIKAASDVGIDKFVVHSSVPLYPDVLEFLKTGVPQKKDHKCYSMDTLSKLAPIAKECGAVICVEDLAPPAIGDTIEELKELLSVDDSLRVCFDVNHLLTASHEEFIKEFAGKIATVHISDYDFTKEQHFWPGRGKINWPELYKMIYNSGYDGVWMYELGLIYDDFSGTFEDLYNRTMDIFSGKQPNP